MKRGCLKRTDSFSLNNANVALSPIRFLASQDMTLSYALTKMLAKSVEYPTNKTTNR